MKVWSECRVAGLRLYQLGLFNEEPSLCAASSCQHSGKDISCLVSRRGRVMKIDVVVPVSHCCIR